MTDWVLGIALLKVVYRTVILKDSLYDYIGISEVRDILYSRGARVFKKNFYAPLATKMTYKKMSGGREI
jgi:hypothetical protein